MNPRIAFIGSYSETEAILRFVREILACQGPLLRARTDSGDGRLVVVKPNWVEDSNACRPGEWESVITHPNVVLAVVEALADLMDGKGTICVCDAPNTYVNFEAVTARGGLADSLHTLRRRFPELSLELLDLRREVWLRRHGVVVRRCFNPPDPRGYVRLDLGEQSLLFGHGGEGRYYGADYDTRVVNTHHHGNVHEYLLSGTSVRCDLFVNLPKLKTHKKTGVTSSLKNLVGVTGDKNWLPHFVRGTPKQGGDEFSESTAAAWLEGEVKRAGQQLALALPRGGGRVYGWMRGIGEHLLGSSARTVRGGDWEGNDTCWRMALDLNRALFYGNADGSWRGPGEAKPYITIVDGIVGGEGNGPLCPDPVPSGVMVGATDPAAADAVICRLMGFDPRRVPIVQEAFADHRWPIAGCRLAGVTAEDERAGRLVGLDEIRPAVPGGFKPHFNWPSLIVTS